MIRSRWSQVMRQLTRAWSKNLCFWVFCVISDTIWILGPYWKSLFHNARTASPIYREAPLCLFEIWAFKQGHGGIIFLTFRGLKCLPRLWVAKKCPKVFWRFGCFQFQCFPQSIKFWNNCQEWQAHLLFATYRLWGQRTDITDFICKLFGVPKWPI